MSPSLTANPIKKQLLSDQGVGGMYSTDTLDKRVIHIPGNTEQASAERHEISSSCLEQHAI